MADNVSGPGKIGPHDKKLYEHEYKESATLFKQALDQYKQSTNMYQQEEFKDVMKKAMKTLNETAQALMRQELLNQNAQIAKDFATFQKFPKDPDTQDKLANDLDKAKKSVG